MKSHPAWNVTLSVYISFERSHVSPATRIGEAAAFASAHWHPDDTLRNDVISSHLFQEVTTNQCKPPDTFAPVALIWDHPTWPQRSAGWARSGIATHHKNAQARLPMLHTGAWKALAFQHGKCSAESWDFLEKNSCASKAIQPSRSLPWAHEADAAKNKRSATKWYWAHFSNCQHQSIFLFQIPPLL